MSVAFVGTPPQAEIQTQLDRALTLYGLAINDESYSRAGSTLVALRKEVGPTEMEILDCTIQSHVPGVNVTFPQAAGIAASVLRSSGGCS